MRKAINISALLFFIWLILDTFQVLDKLMYFLVIGQVPGTTQSLSPTMMLAIMSGLIGIVVFETLARRFDVLRRIRRFFVGAVSRRERLPNRRFTRI
jgi:hypothetical protein